MIVNPYLIAESFLGESEVTGDHDNLFVLWCLSTCTDQSLHDETPWCSGFVNAVQRIARGGRTKSLAARSWLSVGQPIRLLDAQRGDIIILKQQMDDPGPEILRYRGHVGFYSSQSPEGVLVLGGNQHNQVSLAIFPLIKVLGLRRVS